MCLQREEGEGPTDTAHTRDGAHAKVAVRRKMWPRWGVGLKTHCLISYPLSLDSHSITLDPTTAQVQQQVIAQAVHATDLCSRYIM